MAKLTQVPKDLRPLCQSAMRGDHAAAKCLLRIYGHDALAREIKRSNLPFPPRVAKMIAVLTAGTGADDRPGPWEHVEADGSITNDLAFDPPARRRVRVPLGE